MSLPNNPRRKVPLRSTTHQRVSEVSSLADFEGTLLEPWSNPLALKVVFVDDEGDFLAELEQQNAKRREVDLKCLLLTLNPAVTP